MRTTRQPKHSADGFPHRQCHRNVAECRSDFVGVPECPWVLDPSPSVIQLTGLIVEVRASQIKIILIVPCWIQVVDGISQSWSLSPVVIVRNGCPTKRIRHIGSCRTWCPVILGLRMFRPGCSEDSDSTGTVRSGSSHLRFRPPSHWPLAQPTHCPFAHDGTLSAGTQATGTGPIRTVAVHARPSCISVAHPVTRGDLTCWAIPVTISVAVTSRTLPVDAVGWILTVGTVAAVSSGIGILTGWKPVACYSTAAASADRGTFGTAPRLVIDSPEPAQIPVLQVRWLYSTSKQNSKSSWQFIPLVSVLNPAATRRSATMSGFAVVSIPHRVTRTPGNIKCELRARIATNCFQWNTVDIRPLVATRRPRFVST